MASNKSDGHAAGAADGHAAPAAGVLRREVGSITVTALLDGVIGIDPAILSGADEAAKARALSRAGLGQEPVETAVNAYLIEAAGRRILLDTGAGGAFGPGAGRLPERLAEAGVPPDTVDAVMLTHLHGDHFSGLSVEGAAVFGRAELVMNGAEHGFWTDDANFTGAAERLAKGARAARAAMAPYAGRLRLLADAEAVAPGLSLIHLPGHTPGHSGLMVSDGNAGLLLWGDIVHVGAVQFALPKATLPYDVDPAQAAATRARVLDMAASDGLEIAGSHIAFPSFGHVAREGNGYRFLPSR